MKKILSKLIFGFLSLSSSFQSIAGQYTIPGFRPGVNVDGMADYSFSAHESNIIDHFDLNTGRSYLTGYLDGDYKATWTGNAPTITGARSSFQITGAGQGIFHLAHDRPNDGGIFQLSLNGATNLKVVAPDQYQGSSFRTPWINALKGLNPSTIRYMDWMATNNSSIVNWSDRNTSWTDTTPVGVRYEKVTELSNLMNATPWVNIPAKASDDYAFQLGKFLGQNLTKGQKIKVEYSNELWNGGDGAQGTYNLLQARSEGYVGPSDTEKMAQRAAWVGYNKVQKLKDGLVAVGAANKVEWEWGGFIANDYWTYWGMEELKRRGVNIPNASVRLAIAAYAPGSPTDINVTTSDTHAQAIAKIMSFVDTKVLPWIKNNKTMASNYGMLGVDQYENAIASNYTYQANDNSLTQYWIDLQSDPLMRDAERQFITKIYDAQGNQGLYDVFGLVSPWSQYGQWGLLNDTNGAYGPKYLGVQDVIDYSNSSVPEPSYLPFGLLICVPLFVRRKTNI